MTGVITKVLSPAFNMISTANPRYIQDSGGKAIYLRGAHTWTNLQDGSNGTFDYNAYLIWMMANHYNFFRMWTSDTTGPYQSGGISLGNGSVIGPFKYPRTGPGNGADGLLKYDVSQFNQPYFDRLRSRCISALSCGIYVSVMLFNAWGDCEQGSNPMWVSHPYNSANNINGVNGDPNATGDGDNVQDASPTFNSAVYALQQAYLLKVINTVDDLPNVLYEITNESKQAHAPWQYSMVQFMLAHQKKRSPIGMTMFYDAWSFGNSDTVLLAGNIAWASSGSWNNVMNQDSNPVVSTGAVIRIPDTDHIFGMGGDCQLVWREFLRGNNFLDMDDLHGTGIAGINDSGGYSQQVSERLGMTQTGRYSTRVNLNICVPNGALVPSGYCLADPGGTQYILLSFATVAVTVNLSAASGTLNYEWFDINANIISNTGTVSGGSATQAFSTQANDSVLFIYK
jgi:hypothetical protein